MLEKLTVGLSALALALVMIVGVADIVLGELFGYHLAFKVDMSGTMTAAAIFLTWPLVQRNNEHIAVDLFQAWRPRGFKKVERILVAVTGAIFFGLLFYGAESLARDSIAIMERSAATLGYPIWPAKLACAFGALLALLVTIRQSFTALFGKAPTAAGKSDA